MRKYLLLILLLPLVGLGAITPYTQDWEGTNVIGWETSGGGIFNLDSGATCAGANSARAGLTGNSRLATAIMRSPNLGTTDGGEITFSYSYKWLINNGNVIGNPQAAAANALDLKWQWANSQSGPWYTFDTKGGNNHTASVSCTTVTTTFYAYAGKPLYVRLVVSNLTANGNNFIYIDDVDISEDTAVVPTCGLPNNVRITEKTSTSFVDFRWAAPSIGTVSNYEWEVRTSGEPGSGNAGLLDSGTGTLTSASTGNVLQPSSTYKLYVRAICGVGNEGPWIGIDGYTNCDFPAFNPTANYNICGIQDVELEELGPGAKFWYDKEGNLLATGNTYNLTDVDESMSFDVFSGFTNATSNSQFTIGTGIGASTTGVPFPATKSSKVQYIYQASELHDLNFDGGIIKSFGVRVGIGGTLMRSNFTIHMGQTLLEEFATTEFIPTTDLTLVKDIGDQLLVADDVNMFRLDNPFIWDGISNIVVQITYSEDVAASVVATGIASSSYTGSYRTLYTTSANQSLATLYGVQTGTRSEVRTNGYLDVLEGCFGPMKTVNINYTEAPDLILSTNKINNCIGSPLTQLYILSGGNEYDTYEWFPEDENNPNDPNNASNAISGSATAGWTFNPTTNMTYTLVASNSTGDKCVITQEVEVEFNPAPQLLQLESNYDLCTGVIQELKIANNVDETPLLYLFNGNLNGASLQSSTLGDVIANDTTFFSEGTSSLKMTYGAQSTASVVLDAAIGMNNLRSVVVEFDHIAAFQATSSSVMDYGVLEYSTNNGTSWKSFKPEDYIGAANTTLSKPTTNTGLQAMFFTSTSYQDWNGIDQASVPSTTPWKTEKFIVPADEFIGVGTLKIRFKVGADGNTQFPGWLIDNVKITPISAYQITWSPLANLYYDQNATIPYDGTRNVGTVYLKGTTNSLNVPYKVEVETEYGCKAEKQFTVSVGLKEAPVVHNIDSCGPIDVSQTNFGKNPNGVLTYYNSITSNTPITQILSSGVYYVQQEISKCKSDKIPFTVVINQKASVPVASPNQSFCGAATINDLTFNPIQGLQIKWYLTATGGNPLPSGVPINNGTYYGEFTNGVCTSESRVAVNVAVGTVPAVININDVYICGISTIADININAAPNAVVSWYQNIGDVTALPSTTALSSGTYYISQKINNCESTRTAVNVNVIQSLPLPSATTVQTFCGSATVGNLTATSTSSGAMINWYSFSASDTPLDPATPLTSGTYYVGQSVGDCDSPKRPVSIRILSTTAPTINPLTVCGDATVSSLPLNVSTNITYKVYDSMWGTTEMGQNAVVTSGVYYISRVEDGCESLRTAVQVTVNSRPTSPTGNSIQTFDDYAEVNELITNETNVVWFESYNDAINNVNPLHGTHPLQNDKTYYGVIIGQGQCASLPFQVTVKIVLGLNDLDLTSLKYYPNPVETELTVSYKAPINSLEVYDLTGKLIKTQAFDSNDVRLDVSSLSSGTYMIKVHTSVGSQFIKIVKK